MLQLSVAIVLMFSSTPSPFTVWAWIQTISKCSRQLAKMVAYCCSTCARQTMIPKWLWRIVRRFTRSNFIRSTITFWWQQTREMVRRCGIHAQRKFLYCDMVARMLRRAAWVFDSIQLARCCWRWGDDCRLCCIRLLIRSQFVSFTIKTTTTVVRWRVSLTSIFVPYT